jgi:hypothetical protein
LKPIETVLFCSAFISKKLEKLEKYASVFLDSKAGKEYPLVN